MKSKTKVSLPEDEIAGLVWQAFGDVPILAVREKNDGYFNTIYQIDVGKGNAPVILKIGPPADAPILTYEKNLLRAEVESMKLAAANPEIPVPRVLFADFSSKYLPYEYYFMDVIDGVTWDKIRDNLAAEQNKTVEFQLGQITAQINSFAGDSFGLYASGPAFERWADAFRWMSQLIFLDAERYQIPLAVTEQEYFDHFDEHESIFDEVTRPQLVHWDLWAGNILVNRDADSPRIAGIIDFERALWGDPLMESYVGRLSGLDDYFAGYGENIMATPAQRLRRIFYNIYLDLLMIIEDGPRQYEDKGTVRWAKERLKQDITMLYHGDILS